MDGGLERDLRPFSGTARLTAASQLEGQDRCAAVESELKRLFAAKASPARQAQHAQRPRPESWEIDRPERLPKLRIVRPASSPARPRPSRMEERRASEGFEGKTPWTRDEENLQLRRELRRLGGVEARPHFSSVAAENHWLRREATAKLLKAFLSDGASAASTRLPTPSNSTASNSSSVGK